MSARVLRVIETELEVRGAGTGTDPIRRVRQYWREDGTLLAEVDGGAIVVKPGDRLWIGSSLADAPRDMVVEVVSVKSDEDPPRLIYRDTGMRVG